MTSTKIDKYEVMYSSNMFMPRIWLMSGGSFIGQLIFCPNGQPMPPDNNTGGVNLYYHLDDFHNTLDLLRNESPMYLLFAGTGGGNENGIKSTPEPVGEGELVHA